MSCQAKIKKINRIALNTKPYLTQQEAAALLSCSLTMLRKMPLPWTPIFPGCKKLILCRKDIDEYFDTQRVREPDFEG
ncbi:MAG: hypothetical protein HQM10_26970 [Candidatus Riflebacteria bacterium]|nr:hypothetical protein [Candidatus Riflebacteria bacterium]